MRKLLPAILTLFFWNINAHAQQNNLVAEGVAPNLYISYIVASKENYYSIGRLYTASPKELAPYNNRQFDKGI